MVCEGFLIRVMKRGSFEFRFFGVLSSSNWDGSPELSSLREVSKDFYGFSIRFVVLSY